MVTTFENSHQFKVIALSSEEIRTWPRAASCDKCGESTPPFGLYVAAFNLFLCSDCYDEWCFSAKEKHPDQEREERQFLKRAITHLEHQTSTPRTKDHR